MKLVATMHHFSITLNKEIQQRKLITLAMQEAEIEYHEFDDRATARGKLGNLTVQDMRPEDQLHPAYREILGLQETDTSLLKFQYEWYSPDSPLVEQKNFNSLELLPMT